MSYSSDPVVAHCIGRYRFELPVEFVQDSGDFAEFLPKGAPKDMPAIQLHFRGTNQSEENFSNKLEQRVNGLPKKKEGSGLDYLVESQILGDNLVQLKIGNVEGFYDIEIHLLKNSTYLVASLKTEQDEYKSDEAILKNFVTNIDTVNDRVDGVAPGFCVGSAIVRGDFSREWFSTSFRSEKRPDLVFEIAMDTFSKDDSETLFDRVGGPSSLLSVFDVKHSVLRKRELKVAGMHAQEWLGIAKLPDKKEKVYGFALETMRATPSLMLPKIHVDFDSGKPGLDGTLHETSINDSEAIVLWDKLVASICPI